jgi:hypothetical protein
MIIGISFDSSIRKCCNLFYPNPYRRFITFIDNSIIIFQKFSVIIYMWLLHQQRLYLLVKNDVDSKEPLIFTLQVISEYVYWLINIIKVFKVFITSPSIVPNTVFPYTFLNTPFPNFDVRLLVRCLMHHY